MLKDRIREVRKSNSLSQAEFGKKLGVSRDIIANLETGRVEPTELVVKSIANEFDVSLRWLQTGEGNMLENKTRNSELAELLDQNLVENDDIKKRLFVALSKLSIEEWEVLAKIANDLVGNPKKEGEDK